MSRGRVDKDAFYTLLAELTHERTAAECIARLRSHGVPCSPYRTVAEALADPQIAYRGALARVEYAAGEFDVLAPPFRFSRDALTVGRSAPQFGQHTSEYLGVGMKA
ncbi:MAG: hypothetical protein DI623_09180 [Sphingomonas sanxanigenens]|uniref:Uncharacterized protein n=1 Tax=Sphingomonas sanxanigenens TaxID=397260 RepID=A0A2W5ABK1_9SPHN|nr:MAG: hypothetical protein DI623_09180 [Sphingomonas sanxanigenens]